MRNKGKLKVLFLHPNFPGQFKYLAQYLAKKNEVYFLCQTHYGRKLKGVEKICLKGGLGHDELEKKKLHAEQKSIEMGRQYMKGMQKLQQKGWNPDLIISHSGFGCGLYAKAVFKEAYLIAYLEWWFANKSEMLSYDETNPYLKITKDSALDLWKRNMSVSLELVTAEKIVSPTKWQKDQAPEVIKNNVKVIPEGVDTKQFNPIKYKGSDIYITYGTRGMEPIRGFDKFIKSIPSLVKKWPQVRIEIAGDDQICYAGTKPKNAKSWGEWAKNYLREYNVEDKVIFKGRLNSKSYTEWLQNSFCHVYFTHPFVVSWSLIEAYCCGVPIVASKIRATHDICQDTATYVDHRSQDSIIEGINSTLRNSIELRKFIEKNRVYSHHDFREHLKSWDGLINDLFRERKKLSKLENSL